MHARTSTHTHTQTHTRTPNRQLQKGNERTHALPRPQARTREQTTNLPVGYYTFVLRDHTAVAVLSLCKYLGFGRPHCCRGSESVQQVLCSYSGYEASWKNYIWHTASCSGSVVCCSYSGYAASWNNYIWLTANCSSYSYSVIINAPHL